MKNTIALLLISTAMIFTAGCGGSKEDDPLDYINPFMGTALFGHTFPGPSLPYSLIHVSPDTRNEDWQHARGYNYSDSIIIGFSHTHYSGMRNPNGGDILLMPVVNQTLLVTPGNKNTPDMGYSSRFSHQTERASPGYYSVQLKDYNINVELTTTPRVALHRYTFPKSSSSTVVVDLGHQQGSFTSTQKNELLLIDNYTIEGKRHSHAGWLYFVIQLNKPCKYYGTFDNGVKLPDSEVGIFPYKSGEIGDRIGAFLQYETEEGEQLLAKVAISYVSLEGARKNLKTELNHWNFEQVHSQAAETWRKELSVAELSPKESVANKEKFYTALYHSLLSQYIQQDVDGQYCGTDGEIHNSSGGSHVALSSCWATYRTLHPLLTIIAPQHINNLLLSIQDKIRDCGWIPTPYHQKSPTHPDIGDHLAAIITDAYIKGFRNFDKEFVYTAIRRKATENPPPNIPSSAGRQGLTDYMTLGYIPTDKVSESVANTLELAYDDWCIAQWAKLLNKEDDYNLFMNRSSYYLNVWDPESRFMRPKKTDGKFLDKLAGNKQVIMKAGNHTWYGFFDPLLVGHHPHSYYSEANAWQYLWAVQHNPYGLIKLFGTRDAFAAKLDSFFTISPIPSGPKTANTVGTIGQYAHGRQTSHHAIFLYNYAGEPWKAQQKSRLICQRLYQTGQGGLCGNENMGSLSSWYAFCSIGFYPLTPGAPFYAIGSPVHNRVVLRVSKENKFIIEAKNNSDENIYIQSAKLNKQNFDRPWITHEEIMQGGELEFVMGPLPNKRWGLTPMPSP